MKISFVKYEKESNYKIPKLLGMKVEEIQEPEEIDATIVIPKELASFSQDIINKYKYDNKLNIIITP